MTLLLRSRFMHLINTCAVLDGSSCSAEAALLRTKDVDLPGGWKAGDPYVSALTSFYHESDLWLLRVPYAALAKVFALIEATTKRIEKTSLLTSFLLLVIRRRAQGDTQSLLQAVYLCINRVCGMSHDLRWISCLYCVSCVLTMLALNWASVKVCS